MLQLHRRYVEGFQETRRQILLNKPSNKGNWIAYAIGNHLAGHLKKAIDILNRFESSLPEVRRPPPLCRRAPPCLVRDDSLFVSKWPRVWILPCTRCAEKFCTSV